MRETVRKAFSFEAVLNCKTVKGKEAEAANFQNYFNFSSPLKRCKSHQILAIRRGKEEELLQTSIDIDADKIIERISRRFVKNRMHQTSLIRPNDLSTEKSLMKKPK